MSPQNERLTKSLYIFIFIIGLSTTKFVTDIATRNSPETHQTITKHSQHDFKDSFSPWDIAISEAETILSEKRRNNANQPSCFVPNKIKTLDLVKDVLASNPNPDPKGPLLPLPIMNVGMPKCGSTTLFHFFECIGLNATHWDINTNDWDGLCMRDAASVGLPPIATCAKDTDALMELNVQFPFGKGWSEDWEGKNDNFRANPRRDECFFPQLSLLEEIHAENPNVTFVMNFRPIQDWLHSVTNWYEMLSNFQACHLPNLPRGVPKNITDEKEVQEVMSHFLCSHVQHVRNFVKEHPSHALIELDLYDQEGSVEIMASLFPSTSQHTSSECWVQQNKS